MISLVRAAKKDTRFLWELRNDKNIRRNFFDSSPIPYSKHLNWFNDKLTSVNTYIFIIKNEQGKRIGYVRFEREKDNDWKVSVAIAPEFQGKGYGSLAITMGCRRLFKIVDVKKIVAYILKDNLASFNVFRKAGFLLKSYKKVNKKNAAILEMENNFK